MADAAGPLGGLDLLVPCFLANDTGNLSAFFSQWIVPPVEISLLPGPCPFPIDLIITLARPLLTRLEPEATKAASRDLDLTFLERSLLARSSSMSASMANDSFFNSMNHMPADVYFFGKSGRNRRHTTLFHMSLPLARIARASLNISERKGVKPDFAVCS